MANRCPDCNKFVPIDVNFDICSTIESLVIPDTLVIRHEGCINKDCQECGTTLETADIDESTESPILPDAMKEIDGVALDAINCDSEWDWRASTRKYEYVAHGKLQFFHHEPAVHIRVAVTLDDVNFDIAY